MPLALLVFISIFGLAACIGSRLTSKDEKSSQLAEPEYLKKYFEPKVDENELHQLEVERWHD